MSKPTDHGAGSFVHCPAVGLPKDNGKGGFLLGAEAVHPKRSSRSASPSGSHDSKGSRGSRDGTRSSRDTRRAERQDKQSSSSRPSSRDGSARRTRGRGSSDSYPGESNGRYEDVPAPAAGGNPHRSHQQSHRHGLPPQGPQHQVSGEGHAYNNNATSAHDHVRSNDHGKERGGVDSRRHRHSQDDLPSAGASRDRSSSGSRSEDQYNGNGKSLDALNTKYDPYGVPVRSGHNESNSPTNTKQKVQDNVFRGAIFDGDLEAILVAMESDPDNQSLSRDGVRAIGAVLERHRPAFEQFVESSGVERVFNALSRFGTTDADVCSAFCQMSRVLARGKSVVVDENLRASGVSRAVMDCMQWHPADRSVVKNGVKALEALSAISSTMAKLIIESRGTVLVQRALARAAGSFNYDVEVALAALCAMIVFADTASQDLASDGSLVAVLECCQRFAVSAIDERVVRVLSLVASNDIGREALVSVDDSGRLVNAIDTLAQIMRRCANSPLALRYACGVTRDLAMASPRRAATVFNNPDIVDGVMSTLEVSASVQPRATAIGLGADALDALRKMSRLGTDMVGTMHMCGVVRTAVAAAQHHSDSRDIAVRVALLLENMFKAPESASSPASPGLECMYRLQQQWSTDASVSAPVERAISVLKLRVAEQERHSQNARPNEGIDFSVAPAPNPVNGRSADEYSRSRYY